jgi:hypothetical protein
MSIYKFYVIPFCFCIATQLHAAEWRACEKAKLRQLNLEQTARSGGGKKPSRSRSGSSKSRENADRLDEWLWKNCRDYANELRTLEQERM